MIKLVVGYCTLSISELGFKNNSASGYMEGSKVSFYCHDNGNDMIATCMNNGSWNPDPHTYRCQKESMTDINNNLSIHNIMSYLPPDTGELDFIIVIIISIIAVVLLVMITFVIMLTGNKD